MSLVTSGIEQGVVGRAYWTVGSWASGLPFVAAQSFMIDSALLKRALDAVLR